MSSTLKNKMYNHEVTPPETAWKNITISLDEIFEQKLIADKLKNFEATPTPASWSKITTALDHELQEKKIRDEVLNLEVQPPTFAWNKIAQELDTQAVEDFSKKLYEYEVSPPVNNWQKIASILNAEETSAPVISVSKNYKKVIRIAAAAAVIGFLAWGGYSLFNNPGKTTTNSLANNDTNTITPVKTTVAKTNQGPGEIKDNNPVVKNNKDNNVVRITTTPSKKLIKVPAKEQTEDFITTDNHTGSDVITITDTKNLHKGNKVVQENSGGDTEARYLFYLTDRGDMVKLSKKLADLKCIYTKEGNVSQQALAKLDDSQCNEQIKYWQEKMANSSLQSSSNPLELIEILK